MHITTLICTVISIRIFKKKISIKLKGCCFPQGKRVVTQLIKTEIKRTMIIYRTTRTKVAFVKIRRVGYWLKC